MTTLEDGLVASYKTKHMLTIQSSNQAPWCLPEKSKTYDYTKPCAWVLIAAFLIICQNLEVTKMSSVGEWINGGTSRQWDIIQWSKEISYHHKLT